MVHIVNSSQQITHAALAPAGIHSRIVSCGAFLTMVGAGNWGVTDPVAQDLTLLGITVWFSAREEAELQSIIFDIVTSEVEPKTLVQVQSFEKLVPINTRAGFPFHESFGRQREFHWDMNRRFVGSGRRFAVWGQTSATAGGILEASFQISEG